MVGLAGGFPATLYLALVLVLVSTRICRGEVAARAQAKKDVRPARRPTAAPTRQGRDAIFEPALGGAQPCIGLVRPMLQPACRVRVRQDRFTVRIGPDPKVNHLPWVGRLDKGLFS